MAGVRRPVFAIHKIGIDENLAARQTETEDFIRYREVARDVIDVLPSHTSSLRVRRHQFDEPILRDHETVPDFEFRP